MHVARILSSGLFAVASFGQCTLFNQSTCPNAGENPSLASYLANTQSSFQAIDAVSAPLPQPKVTLAAQIVPASSGWIGVTPPPSSPWNNSANINAYMDRLKEAGTTTQDVNLWFLPLSAASQYTGSIASDCPNGTNCKTLANYDAMFTHASSIGVTMRVGVGLSGTSADSALLAACGLTFGSVTEAGWEGCIKPLAAAAVTRWPQIDTIQVVEEPVAGLTGGLGVILSVPDTDTLIAHTCSAVKAANATVKCGAALSGSSYGSPPYDTQYLVDWTTSGTGAYNALDAIAIGVFSGTNATTGVACDPSSTGYAANLAKWTNSYMPLLKSSGKILRIGQMQHPTWCLYGGTGTGEAAAYRGAGDILWQTTGLQDAWLGVITRWAASQGVKDVSVFCSVPLIWYTSNTAADNCVTGSYSATAMSNLSGITNTGQLYRRIGQWFGLSLQGHAPATGRVKLGH